MPIAVLIPLLTALIPEIPALAADFKALITKHPQLADPAAQLALISAIAQAAGSVDDATIAKWAADQKTA
jgi:hypothetical protein